MDTNVYTKDVDNLIYLLSCAVNESNPDIIRINSMNMESLYQLTTAHSLTAMVSFSLEKVIELPHDFDQQKKKVIRKLALFDVEREKLFQQLDNAEIWYMPLKGVVLKDYYPRYGMREMSDNDILCDVERMSDVKRIMESQGFQCTEYGKRVDDTYFKFPLTFEMHRYLFDKNELESLYSYFKNIKEKLLLVDDSRYEYRFTPEDLYVYLTAHEYKHFIHGGTGIRSLLDTYVFLKHNNKELNWNYINQELKSLSLIDFERLNRELAQKVFLGTPMDDKEKQLFMYFVTSGVYGTEDHLWESRLSRELSGDDGTRSKRSYLFSRIFIHGETLKNYYPFVYRHRILLPGLYIYRFIKAVFIKPKKIINEYRRVKRFKIIN